MVDNRAKVYRENADDCRAQAARDQPGEKEAWLKLADEWLRLADSLDHLVRAPSRDPQQSSERQPTARAGDHD
jgi:hypothetical protein